MTDLLNTLKNLGRETNKRTKRTINWGGCCVYAGFVAKKLNNMGIKADVVVAGGRGSGSISLDVARNNLSSNSVQQWNDQGVIFCHVGVLFFYDGQWYTYDSERLTKGRGPRIGTYHQLIYPGTITADEAIELANQRDWNPMFDRQRIPTIQRIINKRLNEVQLAS